MLSGGSVTLPNFVGMTRNDAISMIDQLKLSLVQPVQLFPVDNATEFERVAAQFITDDKYNECKPGDQVMQQTKVTLVVYVPSEAALAPTAEATEAASQPAQEAAP